MGQQDVITVAEACNILNRTQGLGEAGAELSDAIVRAHSRVCADGKTVKIVVGPADALGGKLPYPIDGEILSDEKLICFVTPAGMVDSFKMPLLQRFAEAMR